MPKCKVCGHFGRSVCKVDEEYEQEVKQGVEDKAEEQRQLKALVRRVNNQRKPIKEESVSKQPVLDHMDIDAKEIEAEMALEKIEVLHSVAVPSN